jgi:membrane-bound metal-dependent hydrolase YbcI (DUF457 family)
VDLLTHGFVPYAIFTWMRRPARWRAAALVGGMAPDVDTLWAWAAHSDVHLYPLVHRGASHTLWGAPTLGILLLWILNRAWIQRRSPRLSVFAFAPDLVGPLLFGAMTHLLFDAITITGIPLLWPLTTMRFSTSWFFFGVSYLLPASAYGLWRILRGTATDRQIRITSLVVLGLFLAAGTVRVVSYPHDVRHGDKVTPGPLDWQWFVSRRNDTGVHVQAAGLGGGHAAEFFPEPNRTAAASAIGRCQAQMGHIPWTWDLWGLEATNATRTTDAWHIVFIDSAKELQRLHPGWPSIRLGGSAQRFEPATCSSFDDGRTVFDRPRGWLGG